MEQEQVRIDKWLWSIRVFKSRSLASEACRKGRVFVNGDVVKASRDIKVGDVVEVKKPPVLYRYKVVELLGKRVGAKLLDQFMQDITPEQEIIKLDMMRLDVSGQRDRGTGRPTKKERRLLDEWQDNE